MEVATEDEQGNEFNDTASDKSECLFDENDMSKFFIFNNIFITLYYIDTHFDISTTDNT